MKKRLLILTLSLAALAALVPATASARWKPKPTTDAWQWQLQGKIDTSIPAPVYEVDGFDVPKKTVAELHRKGRKVICYINVGSWETYRSDKSRFPKSVIGKKYDGYPDERWLDISRYRLFAGPMKDRIEMCARKGFDALEPDNMAGYQNDPGFELTAKDQLRYNRWIARQAHRVGLAVALKNDPSQVKQLVDHFDFAVVEECFQYDECGPYREFVRRGKAVFLAEYELKNSEFCPLAEEYRFSAIGKDYDLFAKPWRPCD